MAVDKSRVCQNEFLKVLFELDDDSKH